MESPGQRRNSIFRSLCSQAVSTVSWPSCTTEMVSINLQLIRQPSYPQSQPRDSLLMLNERAVWPGGTRLCCMSMMYGLQALSSPDHRGHHLSDCMTYNNKLPLRWLGPNLTPLKGCDENMLWIESAMSKGLAGGKCMKKLIGLSLFSFLPS